MRIIATFTLERKREQRVLSRIKNTLIPTVAFILLGSPQIVKLKFTIYTNEATYELF